jgi:hypothetical protein
MNFKFIFKTIESNSRIWLGSLDTYPTQISFFNFYGVFLMKNHLRISFYFFILLSNIAFAQVKSFVPQKYQPKPHPRLFLLKGEEEALKKSIQADELKLKIHQTIIKFLNENLTEPPIMRVLKGKRLLNQSREFIRRILYLSYAYRMTKDEKYAQRAEQEMLAVCDFSDWNPSHFLDAAEMTTGMAIGYDWLYDYLPETSRAKISNAIVTLGIRPSLEEKKYFWMKGDNNWNQVCHTGMLLGALAVFENENSLATDIINRSISYVPYSMKAYAPDGAYPEGYGYWDYGTGYNVILLSALEKAFGTDFGLSNQTGFLKTGNYMLNMVGNAQLPFNYSDCGNNSNSVIPGIYWFAARLKDNGLLYNEINVLKEISEKELTKERFLPMPLIWSVNNKFVGVNQPTNLLYVAQGENPIALMRSGWDSKSIFVGFKCGSPSASHGHMDVGSFVLDANGVRWGIDLGMEDYNALEIYKIELFNMKQNSPRWTILRHNNFHHNTLSFDSTLQNVNGKAMIVAFNDNPSNLSASTDLTSLYAPLIQSATRTIAIVNKEKVTVTDIVTNSNKVTKVRWTFVTQANVAILNDKQMELTVKNEKLIIQLNYRGKSKTFKQEAIANNSFEKKNANTKVIGFDLELAPNENASWTVSLETVK